MLAAAACIIALLPINAVVAQDAQSAIAIDAMAESVLLDTCAYLRSAERFSVEVDVTYDDVLKSGPKVQYSRDSHIVLERPNRLRVDASSDKGERSYFYDGKSVTVFRPEGAVFATFEAPGTIDTMLDAAEANGIEMALDYLLRSQPCGEIAEYLNVGTYAGRHFLDGGWYHHLLLETDAADVQMWVGVDRPELRKIIITYREEPGAPQFTALLTEWNFAPVIDGSTFDFAPPEGTHKVDYRGSAEIQGAGK
jgi:hypothetical protein